jgi:hypothetical protein
MFSNSKDQVSLEEAYGSVKKNVINEDYSQIANDVITAIKSTGHMSAGTQGLVTLASFMVPGVAAASTIAGIQHVFAKLKDLLRKEPKEEIVNDLDSRISPRVAEIFAKSPKNRDHIETYLREVDKALDGGHDRHGERQSKKVANAIDGKVQQESKNSTLSYLGTRANKSTVLNESKTVAKNSTLNYLK